MWSSTFEWKFMFVAVNLRPLQFDSIILCFNANFHICLQNQTAAVKWQCSLSHGIQINLLIYLIHQYIKVHCYQTHTFDIAPYFQTYFPSHQYPNNSYYDDTMYCCSRKCHSRYYLCQNGEVGIKSSCVLAWLICCIIMASRLVAWRMLTAPKATLVFLREMRSPTAGCSCPIYPNFKIRLLHPCCYVCKLTTLKGVKFWATI